MKNNPNKKATLANVPVVVASYEFWKRLGGRNDFVGSTLQINGEPYTVIGIAPAGFSGANVLIAPDIWLPLGISSQLGSAFGASETMSDLTNSKNYALNLVGRMRAGLTGSVGGPVTIWTGWTSRGGTSR